MFAIKLLIILFGLIIFLAAGSLALRPRSLTDYLLRHAGDSWMHVLAALVRILMGAALLVYSPLSRFPLTFQILGWIAIIAGVFLALLPPSRFKQLVTWAFDRFGGYARIAGLAAVAFGAFLVYAVL
jgi:uncharacterized protein YjeT (DUF2065 family)